MELNTIYICLFLIILIALTMLFNSALKEKKIRARWYNYLPELMGHGYTFNGLHYHAQLQGYRVNIWQKQNTLNTGIIYQISIAVQGNAKPYNHSRLGVSTPLYNQEGTTLLTWSFSAEELGNTPAITLAQNANDLVSELGHLYVAG